VTTNTPNGGVSAAGMVTVIAPVAVSTDDVTVDVMGVPSAPRMYF